MSKPAPNQQPKQPKQPASVRIMCPNLTCRTLLTVPVVARGKMVRCKNCATCIRVPDAPGQAA